MGSDSDSDDNEILRTVRDVLVVCVIIIGIPSLLAGVYPPYMSILSGSMSPQIVKGDMVVVVDNDRLNDTTHEYDGIETQKPPSETNFGKSGDVIVYTPTGGKENINFPIIHRASFWVEQGENWYEEADKQYVYAKSCDELRNCPADNAGFITRGDANNRYDQAIGFSKPVKTDWVIGVAKARIPYAGWLKVAITGLLS